LSEEGILDLILSLMEISKDGEEGRGYALKANVPGGGSMPIFFSALENGKYRILGIGGTSGLDIVGKVVLELLEKDDLKGAQWWLDLAVKDLTSESDGTGLPALRGLWSGVSPAARGPQAIRIAAAAMIASGSKSDESIRVLQAARAKAPNVLEKSQIDKALCESYVNTKNWTALMETARLLMTSKTFHEEGFRYFVKGASGAKKWKEMEAEAAKRIAANVQHTPALRAQALARLRLGDIQAALDLCKKLLGTPMAGTEEQVFAAWIELAAGKPNSATADTLLKAQSSTSKSGYRIALGNLLAALERPDEAFQEIIKAAGDADYYRMSPGIWTAYAKICEQYGFGEDAAEAYKRAVAATKFDSEMAEMVQPLLPKAAIQP
jgi:hypothetical protein